MGRFPFEVRRVIDELVELWQTHNEPHDLLTHIAGTWKQGSGRVTWFFRQVYEDLRTDKHSNYAAISVSEFKQFLEAEYLRLDQVNQSKMEKYEEHERRARADFDALGKKMAKATSRGDLVELGRKRADLAPHTGVSYFYTSHCWNCKEQISSDIHAQCPGCKYYICSSCGSCFC